MVPEKFALIEFDSIEKAQAWYSLPAQKDADAIRFKSTDSFAFIVEGSANNRSATREPMTDFQARWTARLLSETLGPAAQEGAVL